MMNGNTKLKFGNVNVFKFYKIQQKFLNWKTRNSVNSAVFKTQILRVSNNFLVPGEQERKCV